jgi:GR25 family glycosyltransferase involved in LPS biosynthesis
MLDILNNYKVKLYNIINSEIELFVNKKVKKIYVINLRKNKLRQKYIFVVMQKYKINFSLVVVDEIDDATYKLVNKNNLLTKGEIGCMLSHLWCLNDIIRTNYDNAIIFEDDIVFHRDFHNLFEKIYKDDYNFLVLGACDFSFSSTNQYNVKNDLYVPSKNSIKVYGAHANYYSLNGAKKMFDIRINNISFFDKDYLIMFDFFKNTSYICSPNLVVSDISTSNLQHDYPFFSIQETNYYKKCFVNFNFKEYNFIYLNILKQNKDVEIEMNDTFETYISKIIFYTFLNREYTTKIKNRITMDFFTIYDIKYLLRNL